MSLVAFAQAAAFAFSPVPASPHPEVDVPQLHCLADPQAEAAQTMYKAYVADFSPEVIQGKKPDPALITLIRAEVARCAEKYGWAEASKQSAEGWTLGRLMQNGAWQKLPLKDDAKARLAAALDERGEAGVSLVGLMAGGKTPNRDYTLAWTTELFQEADLEDDSRVGSFLGIYIAGTFFRRFAREQFEKKNVQEQK